VRGRRAIWTVRRPKHRMLSVAVPGPRRPGAQRVGAVSSRQQDRVPPHAGGPKCQRGLQVVVWLASRHTEDGLPELRPKTQTGSYTFVMAWSALGVGQRQLALEQHMVHHLAPAGIAGFVLANGRCRRAGPNALDPDLSGVEVFPEIAALVPAATPGAGAAAATPACHDVRWRSPSRKCRLPARGR